MNSTYQVAGMTCSHCERSVAEEVARVDGIETATVDLATGTLTVTTAKPVERAAIAAAVDEAGYTLQP